MYHWPSIDFDGDGWEAVCQCRWMSWAADRETAEADVRKHQDDIMSWSVRPSAQLARYGLTVADYRRMFVAQGGMCKICHDIPLDRALHIDHDHRCCPQNGRSCGKCIRGLLCHRCNVIRVRMLDRLRDELDREAFMRLIEYVLTNGDVR